MTNNVSSSQHATARPLVSVILATYNEARRIEDCLASILNQQAIRLASNDFPFEVLVLDGMSNDGTRAILKRIAAVDPRLRIIDNPERRTPFAFNLGLRHARGEYVCIFGSHSIYRHDYISICLQELFAHNVGACGGRVITVPASKTLGARLSAWTMSHSFGSSRSSFRTQQEGFVDTVNYPIMRRSLALAMGGYDESLTRNQDNDLNQKLRASGYSLWCTWKTQCVYFPKGTIKGLLRYGFTNGYWNAVSLEKNPASMALRHFVPMIFVLCLLICAVVAVAGSLITPGTLFLLLPLCVVLAAHLGLGFAAAVQVAIRERSPGALCLPVIFLAFHFAYGWGTLSGMAHWMRRRLRASKQMQQQAVSASD